MRVAPISSNYLTMRAHRLPQVEIPPDIQEMCAVYARKAAAKMKAYDALPKWAREQAREDRKGVVR